MSDLFQTDMSWLDLGEEEQAPKSKKAGKYEPKGLWANTDQHKQKVSKALINFYKDPANRAKLSESMKGVNLGRVMSEEQCRLMSERRKGQAMSAKQKQKISMSLKGRKRPPEVIAKIVAARAGYKHSDESRKKISQSGKNRVVSEATRKKTQETQLKNLARPIQTPWGRFDRMTEAAAAAKKTGLLNAANKIRAALNSKQKGYYYIKAKK
jgi:hypothetical protein